MSASVETGDLGIPSPPKVRAAAMEHARTKVAGLNVVASLLDKGCRIIVGLLITPLLVAVLGKQMFGVWQIIRSLISYMGAADGRPIEALKWLMANRQSEDDPELKRRYIGSAAAVWLIFLPVGTLLGGILVWIAPSITKAGPAFDWVVRGACALLVLDFLLGGFE